MSSPKKEEIMKEVLQKKIICNEKHRPDIFERGERMNIFGVEREYVLCIYDEGSIGNDQTFPFLERNYTKEIMVISYLYF